MVLRAVENLPVEKKRLRRMSACVDLDRYSFNPLPHNPAF